MIQAPQVDDFESWRRQARLFLQARLAPEDIAWTQDQISLFGHEQLVQVSAQLQPVIQPKKLALTKDFFDLARSVACVQDPTKWSLLYRLAYRLIYENSQLLHILTDLDVRQAQLFEKSVHRDIHKMHAFVRFKEFDHKGQLFYIAWHRPAHFVTRLATPFFARRFGDRPWSIFTPWDSAHWDLKTLHFGCGMDQHQFQLKDDFDELWKTFYKSIFNPARMKIKMMKTEMPVKYWSAMPETALISDLIREAPARLQKMADDALENNFLAQPQEHIQSIEHLHNDVKKCEACPLFKNGNSIFCNNSAPYLSTSSLKEITMSPSAMPQPRKEFPTMIVFGNSSDISDEKIKLIYDKLHGVQQKMEADAEKTDTVEKKMDAALEKTHAALEKNRAVLEKTPASEEKNYYITSVIKHPTLKNARKYLHACKPWLEKEIELLQPEKIYVVGTTAAIALLGFLPSTAGDRHKVYQRQFNNYVANIRLV